MLVVEKHLVRLTSTSFKDATLFNCHIYFLINHRYYVCCFALVNAKTKKTTIVFQITESRRSGRPVWCAKNKQLNYHSHSFGMVHHHQRHHLGGQAHHRHYTSGESADAGFAILTTYCFSFVRSPGNTKVTRRGTVAAVGADFMVRDRIFPFGRGRANERGLVKPFDRL